MTTAASRRRQQQPFNLQPLDARTQSPLFQRRRLALEEDMGHSPEVLSVNGHGGGGGGGLRCVASLQLLAFLLG